MAVVGILGHFRYFLALYLTKYSFGYPLLCVLSAFRVKTSESIF